MFLGLSVGRMAIWRVDSVENISRNRIFKSFSTFPLELRAKRAQNIKLDVQNKNPAYCTFRPF